MEKQRSQEGETGRLLPQRHRPRTVMRPITKSLIVSALVAGMVWRFSTSLHPWAHHRVPQHLDLKPFEWDDLPTKPHLDFVPCYNHEFQCARLELPMDYWNSSTNATISLAVIKKPAIVPVTHPQYSGAILTNPGGPGGSGIGFLLGFSSHIRDVLEGYDPEEKHFDLLSFDPRGVGISRPGVRCSEDFVFDNSLSLRLMEEGVFSSSDAAFSRIWSLSQLKGGVCSLPVPEGTPDIKKFVSTASVARDMLEIVERHGEWREKEARRLLPRDMPRRNLNSPLATDADTHLLETLKHRPGDEKINYLGFSYGSYLGNTFAAMFPDRINRLVVDGVVDAYDYTKSLWFDNVVDTEKDMDLFYYHCARVGYPRCALANATGKTTEEGVKERTLNIIASLYHNPLPVVSPLPEVIYYSDVKALIVGVLYSPIDLFPLMAGVLAELERGDGTTLAAFQLHRFDCSSCCAQYGKCRDQGREDVANFLDASTAIACSDGDDQSWVTKADFKEHMEKISKLSPTIGEIWATLRLRCVHYEVRPLYRFEGPWIGNTSFPILEIGNTADPVTPGRYAKKMAEGFPGAVALIQDSAGHCSNSAPSNCTETYLRRYFQLGELPEPGTICPADEMPFGPDPGASEVFDGEKEKRRQRAAGFGRAMHASGAFMGGHGSQRMPSFL